MKKLTSFFVICSLFANVAMADCDWSKLVHNQDGTVTYSKELHICVGQMKSDLAAANSQIADYKSAVELKDLAITKSEQRGDMWMNSSFTLQDRMNTIESYKSKNELLYFVGGIVFTGLAVWGAGQLRK